MPFLMQEMVETSRVGFGGKALAIRVLLAV